MQRLFGKPDYFVHVAVADAEAFEVFHMNELIGLPGRGPRRLPPDHEAPQGLTADATAPSRTVSLSWCAGACPRVPPAWRNW